MSERERFDPTTHGAGTHERRESGARTPGEIRDEAMGKLYAGEASGKRVRYEFLKDDAGNEIGLKDTESGREVLYDSTEKITPEMLRAQAEMSADARQRADAQEAQRRLRAREVSLGQKKQSLINSILNFSVEGATRVKNAEAHRAVGVVLQYLDREGIHLDVNEAQTLLDQLESKGFNLGNLDNQSARRGFARLREMADPADLAVRRGDAQSMPRPASAQDTEIRPRPTQEQTSGERESAPQPARSWWKRLFGGS